MDKWIKELQKCTRRKFRDKGWLFEEDGDRYSIEYIPTTNPNSIWLSRSFTIEQLKALVNHMKKYNK